MNEQIEFRNDLEIPIAVRFLVTKLGNLYVDIEEPAPDNRESGYIVIQSHDFDLLQVQPE